jgi:hypothetical protein
VQSFKVKPLKFRFLFLHVVFLNKLNKSDARFESFMVVKIQVKVICVIMPCSIVAGYHHFGGPWCLHPEDGGSKIFQNVNTTQHHIPEDLDLTVSFFLPLKCFHLNISYIS